MFLQFAITLIFLTAAIGFLVWFFIENRAQSRLHHQNIASLETAISTNRFQINFRNSNFNNYDFLKFNLKESLIVQQEIQL